MTLEITSDQIDLIHHHANSDYPQECCGLLVGQVKAGIKRTVTVYPMVNAWTESAIMESATNVSHSNVNHSNVSHSKGDRFWIDPAAMLQVMKQSREQGLEIIGVYHSHPDHAAIPSECDRQMAWPEYSYLIVSVHAGESIGHSCWCLDQQHYFQSEDITMITEAALPQQ